MRIKEAARRTGLSEKTIRYYENRGLVIPDKEERNGRVWRDYTEEHVEKLRAVATLRRAFFHVEEIAGILAAPEKIPGTLREVSARVEATYEALGKLQEVLGQEEVLSSPDCLALAEGLRAAVEPLALPPQDVKFSFRAMDRALAEKQKQVEGAASGSLRFGWVVIYKGQDEAKYQEIRDRLSLFGIAHRASNFTAEKRLAAQGLLHAANPGYAQRIYVNPAGLQARLLTDKRMDSYTIEVRKRDEEKARLALRSEA